MATLSEQHTAAETAYLENADYAETSNAAKAAAFITACRKLVITVPKLSGSREGTIQMNPELIKDEREAAEAWLAANQPAAGALGQSGGSSVRVSFRNCRD